MSTDNSEVLKPYIEHLEFLGYEVSPVGEEKKFFKAKGSPTRWSFVFFLLRGAIFFTVSFGCTDKAKESTCDILKFANNLNGKFFVCRAVVDKDNDINIEARFVREYSKREFGVFIDDIESEIKTAF